MPVFDTSALVPLFNPRHPHHQHAKARFEDAELVILHPSVITGFIAVMWRLAKDHGVDGNEKARQALVALLRQPRVTIRGDLDHDAAVDRYLSTAGTSFTDAVVAASAQQFDKQPPVTFDDRLDDIRPVDPNRAAKRRKELDTSVAEWG